MYSWDKLFWHSLECYFGIYFPSYFTTREINTKIALLWVFKQFVTWVHTLFYILQWTKLTHNSFPDPSTIYNYVTANVPVNAIYASRDVQLGKQNMSDLRYILTINENEVWNIKVLYKMLISEWHKAWIQSCLEQIRKVVQCMGGLGCVAVI